MADSIKISIDTIVNKSFYGKNQHIEVPAKKVKRTKRENTNEKST